MDQEDNWLTHFSTLHLLSLNCLFCSESLAVSARRKINLSCTVPGQCRTQSFSQHTGELRVAQPHGDGEEGGCLYPGQPTRESTLSLDAGRKSNRQERQVIRLHHLTEAVMSRHTHHHPPQLLSETQNKPKRDWGTAKDSSFYMSDQQNARPCNTLAWRSGSKTQPPKAGMKAEDSCGNATAAKLPRSLLAPWDVFNMPTRRSLKAEMMDGHNSASHGFLCKLLGLPSLPRTSEINRSICLFLSLSQALPMTCL